MSLELREADWVFSGGLTEGWRSVTSARAKTAAAGLSRIAREAGRRAPPGGLEAARWLLRRPGPQRDRLLCHPAFDYWLYLWDKHFSAPGPEENGRLQFGLLAPLAAALALAGREAASFAAVADPDGHLHLPEPAGFLELPKGLALKPLTLEAGRAGLSVRGPEGFVARVPRAVLEGPRPSRAPLGSGTWRRRASPCPGMAVESCGLLMTQGVVMHGLAEPTAAEERRFSSVLAEALRHIEERDPALRAEMGDLVSALVPLVNPKTFGSVSSSYVNLRGAICLSHSEDPLLQAETLIHEFCHQKLNLLLLADPVLLPGQSGQVFYSPWRADARRLRGLLLGAHAFLNVSAYLLKSLSREEYPLRRRIALMGGVARRLFEVKEALTSAAGYGSYTPFGSRLVLEMWRQTTALFHAVQWFPPAVMEEARRACAAHRDRHALPHTGFHRAEGLALRAPAPRYRDPRSGARRRTR